jgi:type I restriction enzyme S subunit
VPESWEWANGFDIFHPMTSRRPTNGTFTYIDINAIDNSKHDIINPKVLEASNAPSRASREVKSGDTLFSMVRPYLMNIAYVDSQYDNCIASTGFFVCRPNELLFPKYLFYLMLSPFVVYGLNSFMKGDNSPSINNGNIIAFKYPTPPLSEQQRIVAEIERLFSLVNKIDESKLSLEQFIALTKSKVLDLAIRGKLVPQNPDDEPASVLLERIRNELKFKKTTSDKFPYPFEIPKSWEWCKLGEIGDWQSGSTPSRAKKEYYNGDINWLKTGDLTDDYIYNISEKITQKALLETSVKLNPIGSVLIAMYGATIGKVGILTQPATTNQACCACSNFRGINNLYLFYLLIAYRDYFIQLGEGGAQPNISKEKIISTDIPLPPLAEQLRIVEKTEEIFKMLDKMQANLQANT